EKAKLEYKKYTAKTLDNVEKDYLNTIASLEKQAKTEARKK
ncbi:MAG: cell filamentation protein Fic, partial [Gammaproteobacteria bacterium]|nr:cell filamentation protein Fic [Gammaproteobacteria bacterium]